MADKVEKPSNPMKYPYTFSAKLAQFPFKFYIQNQWMWRYYAFGFVCSLPVFYKIHKLGKNIVYLLFPSFSNPFKKKSEEIGLKKKTNKLCKRERKAKNKLCKK